MADVKTLREVSAELGLSYRACWDAAQKGKLPAVQPFGSGTTWLVAGNYREYLTKAHKDADDATSERTENNQDQTITKAV